MRGRCCACLLPCAVSSRVRLRCVNQASNSIRGTREVEVSEQREQGVSDGVGRWLGLEAEPFRGHARFSSLTDPDHTRWTPEAEGHRAAFNPIWSTMMSKTQYCEFKTPDAPQPETYVDDVPRGDLTFPVISRVAPYTQPWSSTYRLSSLDSFQRVPRSPSSLKDPKNAVQADLPLAR